MYRQYEKLKRLKEALANLKREYKLALENNAGEELLISLHDNIKDLEACLNFAYQDMEKQIMTKAYIIEFAKSCNFEMDKEVKDLSGNTFFSLRHITTETDLIAIYRDQTDGNFYLLGLYKPDKANQLMERFKNSK